MECELLSGGAEVYLRYDEGVDPLSFHRPTTSSCRHKQNKVGCMCREAEVGRERKFGSGGTQRKSAPD